MSVSLLHVRPTSGRDLDPTELPVSNSAITVVSTTDTAIETLAETTFDCVILEQSLDDGTGLSLLSELRQRDQHTPAVLCTEEPDGRLASEATRYVATSYHAHEQGPVELRIGDLITTQTAGTPNEATNQLVDRHDKPHSKMSRSQTEAFKQLHAISADQSRPTLEKIRALLEDHRRRLGVSIGYLSRIEDGTETLVVTTGTHELAQDGVSVPLEATYCQYTIDGEGPLIVTDAETSAVIEQEVYEFSGLSCYLGATVTVDGERYGTICFADEAASRESFDEGDVAFLEVLADVIGHELAQKQKRERLQSERQRVENILERIDDAFFAVDESWNFTYFNSRAEELLHRDRNDVLGENVWELFDDAVDLEFYDQYHHAMETQVPVSFEEYFPPLETWFQVSAYPSPDGLSVYFTDVTERREYTAALSALHTQTRRLVQASTPEEIAEILLDATRDVLGFDLCSVRYRDGDSLQPVAISTPTTDVLGDRPAYSLDAWGVGDALSHRETILVENPRERARTATDGLTPAEVSNAESMLFVPIGDVGVLSIGMTDDTFDETDQSLVELLAGNAEIAFERARREQELRKNEAVLETVQGMVYATTADGQFELLTEPFASWLGYDHETLLTGSLSDVLSTADFDRVRDTLASLRETDESSQTLEVDFEATDGTRNPAALDVSLPPADSPLDGAIGVVTDMTALLTARTQLDAERDRFQYLVENLPDAVTEIRYEGTDPIVESVNEAFEDIFGFERDEVVGQSVNDVLLPEDERENGHRIDELAVSGKSWNGEVQRLTAGGRREFLFRSVPYTGPSGDRYGFGIYTDITERKQHNQRLQVLTRILRHNLRNELSVLLGYADLLRDEIATEGDYADGGQTDRLVRAATSLSDGIDRVTAVTEDARAAQQTLATAQKGPGGEPFRDVVERVLDGYRDEYRAATVTVTVSDSLEVYTDSRLELALGHLVENALEHSGPEPTVRIDATADGDHLILDVADDGPRIPDFEWEVVTGQTEITQLSHGSGLGLWAVRWVTEAYGGSFERRESEMGGEQVRLRLPDAIRR